LEKRLDRLNLSEMQSVDRKFSTDALGIFNLEHALARRNIPGAPGTAEVRKQLARWKTRLKGTR